MKSQVFRFLGLRESENYDDDGKTMRAFNKQHFSFG